MIVATHPAATRQNKKQKTFAFCERYIIVFPRVGDASRWSTKLRTRFLHDLYVRTKILLVLVSTAAVAVQLKLLLFFCATTAAVY